MLSYLLEDLIKTGKKFWGLDSPKVGQIVRHRLEPLQTDSAFWAPMCFALAASVDFVEICRVQSEASECLPAESFFRLLHSWLKKTNKKTNQINFFTTVRSPLGFEYPQAHDRHSRKTHNTTVMGCHMVNEMSVQNKTTNGVTSIFKIFIKGEPPTINSTGAHIFTFCNTSICSSRTPGTYSLEQCSGGWSKFPQSSPPLLPASSLTVQSHSKQSSGSNCHKPKTKQNKKCLSGRKQQSQWIQSRTGSEGRKQTKKKVTEWALDIHLKKKSIGNYISFISSSASVWLLWLRGWRTIVAALLGVGSSTCLLDNYRLAWQWHYQYLGKLFPNYVRRDRNLVLHCVCR